MRCLQSLVLAGLCLGVASVPAAAQSRSNCSTVSQNLAVREVMTDHYFWYRSLPSLDPARFESPEAYLEALRYLPIDRTFSYITSRTANDAYYGNSQFIGLGLSVRVEKDQLRVQAVFDGSPAADAGLTRGVRLVEINGRLVEDLLAQNALGGAWGPAEVGLEVTAVFDTRAGERRDARMVKRLVTIPTIPVSRVIEVEGRTVGYFELRNFVEPSYDAIDGVIRSFHDAGVSELILDLRYNGGGLVDVAVDLASRIGGAVTRGQVFSEIRHNDRHAQDNEVLRFRSEGITLALSRVIIITTRASASASELIINSLRPYLPVVVVGDATYGKPVGQYGFNFCDKTLAPVAFAIVNANGEGDYFDGIRADCLAGDDLSADIGDVQEASLAEALHVVRSGTCSSEGASTSLSRRITADRAPRAVGWQALVNAF